MIPLDRYDYALSWLMAIVAAGALAVGAPLWAPVLVLMIGCSAVLFRHRDDFR
jgi:hypothetical protein